MQRWQTQSGFSLAEVMVSVAILAVVTTAFLGLIGGGARSASRADGQMVLVTLARWGLETVQADYFSPRPEKELPDVTEFAAALSLHQAFPQWASQSYTVRIQVSLSELGYGLYRVTSTARNSQGEKKSLTGLMRKNGDSG